MRPTQILPFLKLIRTQYKPAETIRSIQLQKLQLLLAHAYKNVPYFKSLFDSVGASPADIQKLSDLQLLPLTDKETIQKLPVSEKTAANIDISSCRSFLTSGTTGLPLKFFITRNDLTIKNLICARSHMACGLKPWHKIVVFGGDRVVNTKKSWNERLMLWRRREISAWDPVPEWVNIIKGFNPDLFVSRVTTLRLLAEEIKARKIDFINPVKVFSSAGILDQRTREYLSSAFKCPVIDFYTSFEGGCLAWECEKCRGYHMNSDSIIIEILKDGRPVSPGEEGEVVITNLHLSAMPFIRYRQGDCVVLSEKQPVCGVNLPLIEKINGRKDDYIVLKSGRKIPPQPVYHVMIPVSGVKQWRIIQENIDKLVVEIEPYPEFNTRSEEVLREEILKLLQEPIKIEVRKVDSIPVDPTKKFKPVNSKVKWT